jgi:hypothetical protein
LNAEVRTYLVRPDVEEEEVASLIM